MNGGGRLDDAIHSVRPPAHLESRPYLRPIYDEPEFIVRNVWRLYGGWGGGNPPHLKPRPDTRLAAEVAAMAGGAARVGGPAREPPHAGGLPPARPFRQWGVESAPPG